MAVGFRKSAPVVASGRGGSSTLAALDQERSRTSSARAPLLPTACGIGGMPTRDKVSDNYGRRSALTQTLSDASLQVSLAKPLEQTTQRTLDTEEVTSPSIGTPPSESSETKECRSSLGVHPPLPASVGICSCASWCFVSTSTHRAGQARVRRESLVFVSPVVRPRRGDRRRPLRPSAGVRRPRSGGGAAALPVLGHAGDGGPGRRAPLAHCAGRGGGRDRLHPRRARRGDGSRRQGQPRRGRRRDRARSDLVDARLRPGRRRAAGVDPRRHAAAAGGFRHTMEFLIASACLTFQAEGAEYVFLSGVPLAPAGGASDDDDRGVLDAFLDTLGTRLEPYYASAPCRHSSRGSSPRTPRCTSCSPTRARSRGSGRPSAGRT
jgi:hypothetical protein